MRIGCISSASNVSSLSRSAAVSGCRCARGSLGSAAQGLAGCARAAGCRAPGLGTAGSAQCDLHPHARIRVSQATGQSPCHGACEAAREKRCTRLTAMPRSAQGDLHPRASVRISSGGRQGSMRWDLRGCAGLEAYEVKGQVWARACAQAARRPGTEEAGHFGVCPYPQRPTCSVRVWGRLRPAPAHEQRGGLEQRQLLAERQVRVAVDAVGRAAAPVHQRVHQPLLSQHLAALRRAQVRKLLRARVQFLGFRVWGLGSGRQQGARQPRMQRAAPCALARAAWAACCCRHVFRAV